jgi:hypothetical protein
MRKNTTHLPFSSLIKHLCTFVWSISHFKNSIQGKTGVLLDTMCKYDCWIFGNTWSSSALTSRSLCGINFGYSSQMILLKWSPHYGSISLDSVLASVSPKTGGWTKAFFVEVFMTDSSLGVYSNFLAVPGEEPSPFSTSFILGALGECLVVEFLDDILPAART